MTIIITVVMDDSWATPKEFEQMHDSQVIELAKEDILTLVENATWEVLR